MEYVFLRNLAEMDIDNDSVRVVKALTVQEKERVLRFNPAQILHVLTRFNLTEENANGKNGRNGVIAANLEDRLDHVLAIRHSYFCVMDLPRKKKSVLRITKVQKKPIICLDGRSGALFRLVRVSL